MSKTKGGFSLFGKKKQANTGPSIEEQCQARAEELGRKIVILDEKLYYIEKQIAQLKVEARGCAQSNKRKALNAVRRIKALEKQQDQVWGILQNSQT